MALSFEELIPLDRRERRSNRREEAIALQLHHLIRTRGFETLVLADEFGRALVVFGNRVLGEILAESCIWAPFGRRIDDLALEELSSLDSTIEASQILTARIRVCVDESPLHLLAIDRNAAAHKDLAEAAKGIERICEV